MRYGYNWQMPWRTAVPGYHEWLIKYFHQMTIMSANIQELIGSMESIVRRDFGIVKANLLNQNPLNEDPVPHLKNWGLPNLVYQASTTLSGSLGKTNILPGYLFIKGNFKDGSNKILFDDGNGNLIHFNFVVGSINYAAGTYTIDETRTDIKSAVDFQVSFCDGVINYATEVADLSTTPATYAVDSVIVADGGTGYVIGDIVTAGGVQFRVTNGTAGAVTTLEQVNPSAVIITDPAGAGLTADGGTGTGLTLDITSTSNPAGVLYKVSGAIPGHAASTPGVSIYFTNQTHKILVGYTTADVLTLQSIYDALKSYSRREDLING